MGAIAEKHHVMGLATTRALAILAVYIIHYKQTCGATAISFLAYSLERLTFALHLRERTPPLTPPS